jgi:hypothetical protein
VGTLVGLICRHFSDGAASVVWNLVSVALVKLDGIPNQKSSNGAYFTLSGF